MDFKLTIGIDSNGNSFTIDLLEQPNLFLSYTNEHQLYQSFNLILSQIIQSNASTDILLAYALSEKSIKRVFKSVSENLYFIRYNRSGNDEKHVDSKTMFWKVLLKEFNRRVKLQSKNNFATTNKLIVFIDDIFDLILNQSKKNGIDFLQIAVYGQSVGIHFITASTGIYRNLLIQLIQINPAIEKRITKENTLTRISNPLGSEIILNGDGLIFYKEKHSAEMQRLYGNLELLPMS